MSAYNRRSFIKNSGLSFLPAILPASSFGEEIKRLSSPAADPQVQMVNDGLSLIPGDYIRLMDKIESSNKIEKDFYGKGGAVAALEREFEKITGKEKAIFMPTGTMANQLALKVLSSERTKIFVQETSHVFRDEADAAQSVHNKRLIPLAKGETYFTAEELEQTVSYLNKEEVFKSGMGTVSIENPVRRSGGCTVPPGEIEKITNWSRANNMKLHLDGARIFMATVWSGIPVKTYASFFDTIYISLYKYLGAPSGAVLCGDKAVIDRMEHLMKIYGGTMFGNWPNAAIALHILQGFENRLMQAKKNAEEIFTSLNRTDGVKVTPLTGGTNIYKGVLSDGIRGGKLSAILNKENGIRMNATDTSNNFYLTVNETWLYRKPEEIIISFVQAMKKAQA